MTSSISLLHNLSFPEALTLLYDTQVLPRLIRQHAASRNHGLVRLSHWRVAGWSYDHAVHALTRGGSALDVGTVGREYSE